MSDVLTLVLFVSVTDDGLAMGDDGGGGCFVYAQDVLDLVHVDSGGPCVGPGCEGWWASMLGGIQGSAQARKANYQNSGINCHESTVGETGHSW